MKHFAIALSLFCAVVACASSNAFAQANVTENQTTYLHVDSRSGSDHNPGTSSAPLRSIGAATNKALANNERGTGTKILIGQGTYREFVNVHSTSRQTGAPITFEAVTPGTVVIAGSNVLSGWQGVGNGEFVHSWQDTLGQCYPPSSWPRLQPIVLRREMVFVNGVALTQIMNASDHRPGTFFANASARQLQIWPASGTNMNTAWVEVASRPQTLTVVGRKNVVVRGLVFRHAGSCVNSSSVNVFSSNNILFDKVQANWNNWGGIGINSSSNITVQNSVASYNGGIGFNAYKNANVLLQYTESDYNNWRGALGGFYDFGMGGSKMMLTHGGRFIQNVSYRNHGQGLWFDTDNKNITISNARISENLLPNLKLEGNEGPVSVTDSSFCGGGTGLQLINTAGLSLVGNNFYNNGGTAKWQAQVFLAGNPTGGRLVQDWQTGQSSRISTTNAKLTNNIFTDANSGQYLFSTYLSGSDWSKFAGTLHSTLNKWIDSQSSKAFMLPGGHIETLNGWQNLTGQDQNSSWTRPSGATRNCGVPAPSYADFNVYTNNRVGVSARLWSQPYYMSKGVSTIPVQVKSFNYGTVHLLTSRLPTGVSASFSASSLSRGNSVLTLRASSRAATENVAVTIFGTSGNRVHSVTVVVGVRP